MTLIHIWNLVAGSISLAGGIYIAIAAFRRDRVWWYALSAINVIVGVFNILIALGKVW